ncbi:MAG: NFACT RNA binding domain-containing protein [Anaeromyxobacteraceae bacterium]
MSLSVSEIAAVVVELAPLVGSRVDAVRVHGERALTLHLYGRAGAATLLLSAEADLTRLHVTDRRLPQPPAPYALQGILRRDVEGATLAALTARPGDRVVELAFDAPSGRLRLVAELTGRHGNVFLLDAAGTILASAGRNLSERRELVPGRPYVPPVTHPERDLAPRFAPVEGARFPLSAAIDERYRALEAERAAAEGRKRLRDPVRAALARSRRALEKLAEEALRIPAAEEDRRKADLLKSSLHAVKRGARTVAVTEWTADGAREVTVSIDPALTPRENMERYYRRYRRIVESASRVAEREAEVRGRVEALLALAAVVDTAAVDDLPRLEREARRLGAAPRPPPRPRSERDLPLPPYRAFRSASEVAILVGRGAADNDALTLKVARGNDMWLHARGQTGAHVVVRVDKGKAPDGETLLDAAHLAAHFSDARGEPQVDVAYTRAKYVRKPKGSAPGAVTYSQDRTLLLRVEPQRIERLLATEES